MKPPSARAGNTLMPKTVLSILALLAATATAQTPLKLSLKQAVDLALSPDGSTQVQLAGEGIRQAQAKSAESRSALLPTSSPM